MPEYVLRLSTFDDVVGRVLDTFCAERYDKRRPDRRSIQYDPFRKEHTDDLVLRPIRASAVHRRAESRSRSGSARGNHPSNVTLAVQGREVLGLVGLRNASLSVTKRDKYGARSTRSRQR